MVNGDFVFKIIVYPLNRTSLFFGRGFFIGSSVAELAEDVPMV